MIFAGRDPDTLLTALYVLIDDHVIASGQHRPGHPKKLPDGELVRLAVAQMLPGARSEYHRLLMCYGRLGHLFPYLPKQPGYHKRLKASAPRSARPRCTWPRCDHRGPMRCGCWTRPRGAARWHDRAGRQEP